MTHLEAFEAFQARCNDLGLEVETDQYRRPAMAHVQVYAPEGMAFQGSGTSSSCLLDHEGSATINWTQVLAALEDELPLVPCESEEDL